MNECSIHSAAMAAAGELAETVAVALTATELKLFLNEAYHVVCKALIEARQRRGDYQWRPSLN
jgi:hypothetical protein